MEEWRYSSVILCLGTRWRWEVSFTPRPLYSRGKSLRYPLDRRLGGPQSRSGPCGEENKSLASTENRTPAIHLPACRCFDGAIPAPVYWYVKHFLLLTRVKRELLMNGVCGHLVLSTQHLSSNGFAQALKSSPQCSSTIHFRLIQNSASLHVSLTSYLFLCPDERLADYLINVAIVTLLK
jgi:hypothetical protein